MHAQERMVALVPEAGSDNGWSVVKSMMLGYEPDDQPHLVFTDCDKWSPAMQYRTSYVVPNSTEHPKEYLEAILHIVDHEGVNIILPTSDFDVQGILRHRNLFDERGVILALSPLTTYLLWEDKMEFAIVQPGIHPLTTVCAPRIVPSPVFAKPRLGVGSRGIQVVTTREQASHLEDQGGYIFQELLRGNQCTVDVLCDFQRRPLQAVTREVTRLRGGADVVCQIVEAPKLEKIAMELCEEYEVIGAACFEFMFDEDGEPKLIDAQPRLSGAHIVTTHAGLNIPHWILRLAQGETFTPQEIKYGMKVIRQLGEEILW